MRTTLGLVRFSSSLYSRSVSKSLYTGFSDTDSARHLSSSSGSSENSSTACNIFDTTDYLSKFALCETFSTAESALFNTGRSIGILTENNIALVREALSSMKGGTLCAMKLRDAAMKARDKSVSNHLKSYLEAAFSRDILEFKQVTFEHSTGLLLERVAKKDSVLAKIRSIRSLKKRLGNGRRCYALLHPDLPEDPVAFIHVALTQEIANSLPYLDQHCLEPLASASAFLPRCAMFYSVNSPHTSLGGLDLATKIIKLAAEEVSTKHPSVDTFCTLSPIPGFMQWLEKASTSTSTADDGSSFTLRKEHIAQISAAAGTDTSTSLMSQEACLQFLYQTIAHNNYSADWITTKVNVTCSTTQTQIQALLLPLLRPTIEWLGKQYLSVQKDKDGLPYDPVARFHLRNGASLHRLNWMGNPSAIGLCKSAGLMVNYLYEMPLLRQRALSFPDVHVNENF